jgi:hypothetical protein
MPDEKGMLVQFMIEEHGVSKRPHRTIEETFCWALGRVNCYLIHDLSQVVLYFSLTSPSPP